MITTTVSWKDAAGERNYALPISPQVDLTKDTTVTFDLAQAKKITVETPKPTQTYNLPWFGYQRLAVKLWQINESVHAPYGAQNYWVLPTSKVTQGTFRSYDQFLMGAPPVRMSTTGSAGVALHPKYQSLDPQIPEAFRAPPASARVRGAVPNDPTSQAKTFTASSSCSRWTTCALIRAPGPPSTA